MTLKYCRSLSTIGFVTIFWLCGCATNLDSPVQAMVLDDDFVVCLALTGEFLEYKSTTNGGCDVAFSESSLSSEAHYNGAGGRLGISAERLPTWFDIAAPSDLDADGNPLNEVGRYLFLVSEADTQEMSQQPAGEVRLQSTEHVVDVEATAPCKRNCDVTVFANGSSYVLEHRSSPAGQDYWEFVEPAEAKN